MILRSWRARAAADRAHLYPEHLVGAVLPRLRTLPGFLGAYLLRRVEGDEVEFVVQTLWASMAAVEQFAGPTPELAVVEPAARAALTSYDATVRHYDVLVSPSEPSAPST